MSINKIEMQDDKGNIYYPHTDASVVKYGDTDIGSAMSEIEQQQNTSITDINFLKGKTVITLIPAPTYTIVSQYNYKIGKIVYVQFYIKKQDGSNFNILNSWINVATMPTGTYNPNSAILGTGDGNFNVAVFSDSTIKVYLRESVAQIGIRAIIDIE